MPGPRHMIGVFPKFLLPANFGKYEVQKYINFQVNVDCYKNGLMNMLHKKHTA